MIISVWKIEISMWLTLVILACAIASVILGLRDLVTIVRGRRKPCGK